MRNKRQIHVHAVFFSSQFLYIYNSWDDGYPIPCGGYIFTRHVCGFVKFAYFNVEFIYGGIKY